VRNPLPDRHVSDDLLQNRMIPGPIRPRWGWSHRRSASMLVIRSSEIDAGRIEKKIETPATGIAQGSKPRLRWACNARTHFRLERAERVANVGLGAEEG